MQQIGDLILHKLSCEDPDPVCQALVEHYQTDLTGFGQIETPDYSGFGQTEHVRAQVQVKVGAKVPTKPQETSVPIPIGNRPVETKIARFRKPVNRQD